MRNLRLLFVRRLIWLSRKSYDQEFLKMAKDLMDAAPLKSEIFGARSAQVRVLTVPGCSPAVKRRSLPWQPWEPPRKLRNWIHSHRKTANITCTITIFRPSPQEK